jgi:hypothetical protein
MDQQKVINIDAEVIIGQIVSASLLNSFYLAQILHVLQGNELNQSAIEEILQQVVHGWSDFCDARKSASLKPT